MYSYNVQEKQLHQVYKLVYLTNGHILDYSHLYLDQKNSQRDICKE